MPTDLESSALPSRKVDRFQAFRSAFTPNESVHAVALNTSRREFRLIQDVPGLTDLMAEFAGKTLNRGIYRLFDEKLATAAARFVESAYPAWHEKISPFGCDWMGRIFAVDGSDRRADDGERCAFLLDPATRDLLDVPASVTELHNSVLIRDAELALEESLWNDWLESSPHGLGYWDLAGRKVPDFLGGSLELANLDVQPATVYWDLSGQIIQQTFKLKPGTRIDSVKIE